MKKPRRAGLSTSGRVVALLAALTLAPLTYTVPALRDVLADLGRGLGPLTRILFVVLGALATGHLWDKLTGSRPEEVRGRRPWSDDPTVQKVQSMEETHMLVGALFMALFFVGNIVALWQAEERGLAWVVAGMAVVGSLIVWRLTRKQRPYRSRDRRRREARRKARRDLEQSLRWPDE